MKTLCNINILAPLCLAAFISGAALPAEKIRWSWHGSPLIGEPEHKGERLQFGLRSDGVVVWRELLHSTNSPAEAEEARGTAPLSLTNFWFNRPGGNYTNDWIFRDGTNALGLTNIIYLP